MLINLYTEETSSVNMQVCIISTFSPLLVNFNGFCLYSLSDLVDFFLERLGLLIGY